MKLRAARFRKCQPKDRPESPGFGSGIAQAMPVFKSCNGRATRCVGYCGGRFELMVGQATWFSGGCRLSDALKR